MADLLDELRTYLLDTAPNAAQIVELVADRIFIDARLGSEIDDPPNVILSEISVEPTEDIAGRSWLDFTTVQADCWAVQPSVASVLRSLLRDALQGFRGSLGQIFCRGIQVVTQSGHPEPPIDASGVVRRGRIIQFRIAH